MAYAKVEYYIREDSQNRKQERRMAQRVQVELVDDLSGETADETVRFGLDGTEYEDRRCQQPLILRVICLS
jgi:hypothetical protein